MEILRLVRGTETLDLLPWLVDRENWLPRVAVATPGRIPPTLEESLDVRPQEPSADALAAALQLLHKMQEGSARYIWDATEQTPVWLHAKLYGEANERRSLVYGIQADFASSWYGGEADEGALEQTIVITRHPYWEALVVVNFPAATPAAAAAVVYNYTLAPGIDIPADAGARIAVLDMSVPAEGPALDRFWIGLRSELKHPGLADFVPIWEFEHALASLGTDASRQADALASPGGGGNTRVTIAPGTTTWAKRWSVTIGAIAGGVAKTVAQYGLFLWLLRFKVKGGTWDVHLRWGYRAFTDAEYVQGPIVRLTNGLYDFASLGLQFIPLRDRHVALLPSIGDVFDAYGYTVQLWARRVAGGAGDDLYLDCLCPVPLDEGFAYLQGCKLDATTHLSGVNIGTSPEDRDFAISYGTDLASFNAVPAMNATAFRLPVGDGRAIIVYARATQSVLADAVQLGGVEANAGFYYPRWLSLRGAE